MKKSEFVKIAFELGYTCKYSGQSRTFYICQTDEDVSGDYEFKSQLMNELQNSGFKVVETNF